jgi:hypothetical protein
MERAPHAFIHIHTSLNAHLRISYVSGGEKSGGSGAQTRVSAKDMITERGGGGSINKIGTTTVTCGDRRIMAALFRINPL